MQLCGGNGPKTILSELQGPHSVGLGIFSFFSTSEANALRLVCKEMRTSVSLAEWNDSDTCIIHVPRWARCFPNARSALVDDLYDDLSMQFSEYDKDSSDDIPDDHFALFGGLRKLRMMNMRSSNRALRFLGNLRELECINCTLITDSGLQTMTRIHSYRLEGNYTDAAFANTDLRQIRNFDVSGCHVSPALISRCTNLNSLDVLGESLSDAHLPNFRGIHSLKTSYANISSFQHLRGIHTLSVPNCISVTDESISHLSGIQNLDISFCKHVTGSSFGALKNIKSLKARGSALKDDAISFLSGIESLDISRCYYVTDKSFVHLVGIRHLIAEGTFISDAGFRWLRGIETLNISSCDNISDKAFFFLTGIKVLVMQHASKRLTDKAFLNLAGIHELHMDWSRGKRIKGLHFDVLKGIKIFSTWNCSDEVREAANRTVKS